MGLCLCTYEVSIVGVHFLVSILVIRTPAFAAQIFDNFQALLIINFAVDYSIQFSWLKNTPISAISPIILFIYRQFITVRRSRDICFLNFLPLYY